MHREQQHKPAHTEPRDGLVPRHINRQQAVGVGVSDRWRAQGFVSVAAAVRTRIGGASREVPVAGFAGLRTPLFDAHRLDRVIDSWQEADR